MDSGDFNHALFPLTVFDRLFERSAFVTGWVVEGTIDVDVVASALKRVTDKWRMLAGRLESIVERDVSRFEMISFTLILMNCCSEHKMVDKDPFGQPRSTLCHLCSHKLSLIYPYNTVHSHSDPVQLSLPSTFSLHTPGYAASIRCMEVQKSSPDLLAHNPFPFARADKQVI